MALKRRRLCSGSWRMVIPWECIPTATSIKNSMNRWIVSAEDFARIRDDIYQATGVESIYYRFPGGSSNTVSNIDMHEFIDYLDSQGVEYFDWNVSSGDGGSRNLLYRYLVGELHEDIDTRDTSIILLHDSAEKPTTVEALPDIIENTSGQTGYGDLADHGEYQAGASCGIIAILKVQTGELHIYRKYL